MFRFKMLTKVLVAIFVLGQLIESNLMLCIAMSIDLDAQASSLRPTESWQVDSATQPESFVRSENGDQDGDELWSASRKPASTSTTTTTATTEMQQLQQQTQTTTATANASSELNAPLEGDVPAGLSGVEKRELATKLSQTLESNGKLNFFGKIYVGEKQVPFMVLFDLTSSAFWLPSSECQSFYCISRQKYNGSQRALAASNDEAEAHLNYDGRLRSTKVSTRLVQDSLTFAGVTITNQTFGEALEMAGDWFAQLPVDGFFGLGFKELHTLNSSSSGGDGGGGGGGMETPFERLYRMGLLKEPIFSLLIEGEVGEWGYSAHNGRLLLGELAQGYEQHHLTYVPVTHVDYWEFHLSSVSLRQPYSGLDVELACESACPAILDTGSPLISGHQTDVDRLNRAMGAYPVGEGLYRLAHCDLTLMPNLVLNIGGAEFSLAPDEYVTVQEIRGMVVACYSALRVVTAEQYPFWILGEQFLKRHYVVFDYGQKRIGFAKSKSQLKKTEPDIYARVRPKMHIF